nr:hypothetical protein [Tanacetum cinerariifolium]
MKTIGEPLVRSEVAAGYGDDGTASKKLITDTGDKGRYSLPVISLLLFKVVYKHWLSVITSPNFTSRLSRIPSMAPACGLFLWRPKSKVSMEFEYDFLSLDSRIPSKRSITTFSFGFETGCKVILDSCNGLLLFRSGYYRCKLYVRNPTINLFKMLPPHSIDMSYGVIMAFDPAKSPHYKVLSPQRKDVLTTKLPRPLDKRVRVPCDHKFIRSRGYLLLICKEYFYTRKLFVYEMRNWDSGWFVKYFINLDDVIMNPFLNDDWSIGGFVWCYVLGEREDDSFMVINLCGKVVEYKPLLKTFRELLILDTVCPHSSHEFISSFAGV